MSPIKRLIEYVFGQSNKTNQYVNTYDFIKEISQFNAKRLHLISYLFIIFSLSVIGIDLYIKIITGIEIRKIPYYYYYPFFILVILNVASLVFYHSKKWKTNLSIAFFKRFEWFIRGYVFITLLTVTHITIVDYYPYKRLFMYIISSIICCSFFLIKTRYIVFSHGLCSYILVKTLDSLHGDELLYYLQIQLIISCILILALLSRLYYQSFINSFITRKELSNAIERTNQLALNLKKANKELEKASITDELTKLLNRRGLYKYLHSLSLEEKSSFIALFLMDIDFFKKYNDYFGHSKGDELLEKVSQVFKNVATNYHGVASRWGGEEFLLLFHHCSIDDVKNIYSNIFNGINALNIKHPHSSVSDIVTLSMGGYANTLCSMKDFDYFINQADTYLYHVKNNDRNGVCFCYIDEIIETKNNGNDIKKAL